MAVQKVALLTAGGLAPCLSSAVGGLIQRYTELAPEIELIAYRGGYQGLLLGEKMEVTPQVRENAYLLHEFGGSPIVNSRVKLTNVADCVKRGLVKEGQDPQKVAADQLVAEARRAVRAASATAMMRAAPLNSSVTYDGAPASWRPVTPVASRKIATRVPRTFTRPGRIWVAPRNTAENAGSR